MSRLNDRQRRDLDNYITGHYGEDQFKNKEEQVLRISTEGTVTAKSINKEGEIICAIVFPDPRYPYSKQTTDVYIKTSELELGQKVTLTITDAQLDSIEKEF